MAARGKLTKDRVLALAKEQKLDVARLEKDMDTPEIQGAIDNNLKLAASIGVDGTPAFIIGDQFAPGALPIEQLREMVAQARKK
jgi:protein-disulfide isomerase